MKKLVIAAVCFCVAYAAYPYVELYRLANAVRTQDTAALRSEIDWHSIRRHVKDHFDARLLTRVQKSSLKGGWATIGLVLGKQATNISVDEMATPAVFAMELKRKLAEHHRTYDPLGSVRYAFFESPIQFLVKLGPSWDIVSRRTGLNTVSFRMSLKGFSWTVTRVILTPQCAKRFEPCSDTHFDERRDRRAPRAVERILQHVSPHD